MIGWTPLIEHLLWNSVLGALHTLILMFVPLEVNTNPFTDEKTEAQKDWRAYYLDLAASGEMKNKAY